MPASPISVMVVDEETRIRQGLSVLLEGTEGFSCAGTYHDGTRFLDELARRTPDVVVLALEPSGIGVDAIREALRLAPDLTILVLSPGDDDNVVFEALAAGATGYLTKPMAPAKLLEAIHDAYHGGSPMSSSVARKVVSSFSHGASPRPVAQRRIPLTRRETDVLTSLAEGKSYKEIARVASMSVNTVRYHIRNLYDKLGVHSQSEAVAKGLRQGLI